MKHVYRLLFLVVVLALPARGMAADALTPTAVPQFFDNSGALCVGCKLFTYQAGTTTKTSVFTDSAGGTAFPNPIVLNSRGEPANPTTSLGIWLVPGTLYKFVLAPSTDTDPPTNPYWTVDNISTPSIGTAGSASTGTSGTVLCYLNSNCVVSGAWQFTNSVTVTGSITFNGVAIPQPGSPTLYVSNAGSDSNACTNAAPCATIQHAWNVLIGTYTLTTGGTATIQLVCTATPCTYTETTLITAGIIGGGHVVSVVGDTANPQNFIITNSSSGTYVWHCTDFCEIQLSGVTLSGGLGGLFVDQFSTVDLSNDHFSNGAFAGGGYNILVSKDGVVNLTGPVSIVGAVNILGFAYVQYHSVMDLNAQTISIPNATSYGANSVFSVVNASLISSGGAATFSGAGVAGLTGQKYNVVLNGVLNTSGTTFPGSIAGATATGGQASP